MAKVAGKLPSLVKEGGKGGALQAAEKRLHAVILSAAKNLALSIFSAMRDPSSSVS